MVFHFGTWMHPSTEGLVSRKGKEKFRREIFKTLSRCDL